MAPLIDLSRDCVPRREGINEKSNRKNVLAQTEQWRVSRLERHNATAREVARQSASLRGWTRAFHGANTYLGYELGASRHFYKRAVHDYCANCHGLRLSSSWLWLILYHLEDYCGHRGHVDEIGDQNSNSILWAQKWNMMKLHIITATSIYSPHELCYDELHSHSRERDASSQVASGEGTYLLPPCPPQPSKDLKRKN